MMEASQDLVIAVWPTPTVEYDTQNSRNAANRLPLELMSHIFVLTEKLERDSRERICKGPYLGIQDRVTQVCRYWRDAAINTQILWSYIHVTRPPPHRLAALYVFRAGTSTLLDINIEIRSRYKGEDSSDGYIGSVRKDAFSKTLHWLITSGARMDRWRSAFIGASNLEVLAEAFEALPAHRAPALRTLSFHWDCLCPLGPGQIPGHPENTTQLSLSRLSNASMPHLRGIELIHVPENFLLRQPMLPLQQLTTLSYTAPIGADFSASSLTAMVSACPLLESLSVDDSFTFYRDTSIYPSEHTLLQSLRSLSIKAWNPEAVRQTLTLIDVPMLHSLAISITRSGSRSLRQRQAANSSIAHYISSGRTPGNIFNPPSPTGRPTYPQLRELDISEAEFDPNDLAEMFNSLPLVTHLVLSEQQAWSLGKQPWPMPKLASLKFPRGTHEQFGEVLRRRSKAGFPIECIGLPSYWEAQIGRDLRCWSRVEVIPDAPEVGHDDHPDPDNEEYAPNPYNYSEDWFLSMAHDDLLLPLNFGLNFGLVAPSLDYDDFPDPLYEFE